MERMVLSVAAVDFKDAKTGEVRCMYKVYFADDSGSVGYVYSAEEYAAGDVAQLIPAVNKEGRLTLKIKQPVQNPWAVARGSVHIFVLYITKCITGRGAAGAPTITW